MLNSPTLMKMRMSPARFEIPRIRLFTKTATVCVTPLLLARLASTPRNAQQRLSKRYPAGKNVRIELKNISGTITVESWNRDEIKLTATLESPRPTFHHVRPATL